MENLVQVVYVGNKPAAYDNIARSGKTWAGKGDIQEVTEVQAKQLIKFTDQWQLASDSDAQRVAVPESMKAVDEDGNTVQIDPEAFKKALEKMTKAELVAYAKDKWGKDIDATKSKKDLIDMVEEFEQFSELVVGKQERTE